MIKLNKKHSSTLAPKRLEFLLAKEGKKLVTYFTFGDPDIKSAVNIMKSLVQNGADIIELGLPFSDASADGLVISEAATRAISRKADSDKLFVAVKDFRKSNMHTPLIIMGYYNMIVNYPNGGMEGFCKNSAVAGIDGLIIVDLPKEENDDLLKLCKKYNLHLIMLVSPVSGEKRIKLIAKKSSGFIYYVNITGVSGAKIKHNDKVVMVKNMKLIKKYSNLPLLIGFGIKNRNQAKEIAGNCDGVVIGSAIVKILAQNKTIKQNIVELSRYIKSVKSAINNISS